MIPLMHIGEWKRRKALARGNQSLTTTLQCKAYVLCSSSGSLRCNFNGLCSLCTSGIKSCSGGCNHGLRSNLIGRSRLDYYRFSLRRRIRSGIQSSLLFCGLASDGSGFGVGNGLIVCGNVGSMLRLPLCVFHRRIGSNVFGPSQSILFGLGVDDAGQETGPVRPNCVTGFGCKLGPVESGNGINDELLLGLGEDDVLVDEIRRLVVAGLVELVDDTEAVNEIGSTRKTSGLDGFIYTRVG